MTITQTIDVPANRVVTLEIPPQIPGGRVVLTFKSVLENTEETEYTYLSKEDAISMTADVIAKYRPALEDLAK